MECSCIPYSKKWRSSASVSRMARVIRTSTIALKPKPSAVGAVPPASEVYRRWLCGSISLPAGCVARVGRISRYQRQGLGPPTRKVSVFGGPSRSELMPAHL